MLLPLGHLVYSSPQHHLSQKSIISPAAITLVYLNKLADTSLHLAQAVHGFALLRASHLPTAAIPILIGHG